MTEASSKPPSSSHSMSFQGLGASAGVASGRVHVVDRRRVAVPHYYLPGDQRSAELDRFEQALKASEAQFAQLQLRTADGGLPQLGLLLSAHAMILRDPMLEAATRERVLKEGKNAEWALQITISELKRQFEQMEQDYFRERGADVDYVGERVLRNLVGASTDVLEVLGEDAVVVCRDLSPADTLTLAKSKARGFVTETGGSTSHTAIMARAMNVPCVLSVPGIVNQVGSGDPILLDGRSGLVVVRPSPEALKSHTETLQLRREEEEALLRTRSLRAETTDGVRIRLLGNIEVSSEVPEVLARGAEGVGLYRTEFLYLERPETRSADDHAQVYTEVVRAMEGRPVTIRTLDVGADKIFSRRGQDEEKLADNPALGLRAIRRSLKEPEGFKRQIEGALRASAEGPVGIMLPLITGLEEFRRAKTLIFEVAASLSHRSIPYDPDFEVGVMVETPAAVWVADQLAKEADFLSIGSNDLIQYSLATDRTDPAVSYLYRPTHPAVLRAVRQVVLAADAEGVPLTVCGEIGADPLMVPILIGLGLRRLSMTPWSIPMVKRRIRRLSLADCQAFVAKAVDMATADEVEALRLAWFENA